MALKTGSPVAKLDWAQASKFLGQQADVRTTAGDIDINSAAAVYALGQKGWGGALDAHFKSGVEDTIQMSGKRCLFGAKVSRACESERLCLASGLRARQRERNRACESERARQPRAALPSSPLLASPTPLLPQRLPNAAGLPAYTFCARFRRWTSCWPSSSR